MPAKNFLACHLVLGCWFGLGIGVASADEPPTETVYAARVSRVFDGDTLWVKPLDGGRYRKLRIDGIDAPEICQGGGIASRDALARRVLHQVVEVRVRGSDDYGRGIAKLRHQSDDVAAWMVVQGQAWSYRWGRSLGPFKSEEAQARQARKGLFADASPELPRAFRQRHGPCPLPPR
ncbi:thermonuclease family protein [Hydrogenophaga sp. BPS33]|uniref:thermonuclease family protein n=1 Tax=Hydrogenophaga sp. BPS33 TaxID=2651974 RepID=UPI00131FDD0D|nr:thermonuclease family protein [Hydrogenophaga sp. BPS33]QHE87905.1 thermonuclease family protein [Hydrogenophaga sp. BPS33]